MDRLRLAAVAQVVLEGVELPAERSDLVAYAEQQRHAPEEVVAAVRRLPERQYGRLDEVGEQIVAVQPVFAPPSRYTPQSEDGSVPGGDAYVQANPEPGSIRDAPEILEYEVELVREPGGEQPEKGKKAPGPPKSARSS